MKESFVNQNLNSVFLKLSPFMELIFVLVGKNRK